MAMICCRILCVLAIFGIVSASSPAAFAQSAEGRFVHQSFAYVSQGDDVFVFGGLLYFEGNTWRFTPAGFGRKSAR